MPIRQLSDAIARRPLARCPRRVYLARMDTTFNSIGVRTVSAGGRIFPVLSCMAQPGDIVHAG